MKPRTLILMGVAVVCGLVASYLTSRMLAQQNSAPQLAKVSVLVAKAKIPYGTQIKDPEKYFVTKEYAAGSEPKRAFRSFEEVKDRRVNKPISAEVFVTPDDLMSKQDEAMAGVIPVGTRAFTIPVKSDTNVGGFVLPLMRVDVLGNIRTDKGLVAKTILQDVLVLGVDMKKDREEGTGTIQSSTVTLQVKPDEAELLNVGLGLGELRLTLRGMEDRGIVKTPGARGSDLLKDKGNKGEGSDESENPEGDSSSPSPVAKVPSVNEAPPAALPPPPPPPEPTTTKHVITFINGQDVRRHHVTVDKKTGQPIDSDVDKAEADLPRPKYELAPDPTRPVKPETKGEGKGEAKGEAKGSNSSAEATEPVDEVK